MGPEPHTFARRARLAVAAATLVGAVFVLLGYAPAAGAQVGCTPVMGQATASPAQLAGWFGTAKRQARLDVSVADLATMFIEEGAREGVRGDIAFAQAIVETGYFGFSPSVPPELHNYSGLGATGGGVRGAGFPDARSGVRAQVQHLRAYADPTLRSAADLKAPLVDPRFKFLVPNKKTVPCWEQFGGGIWAADPTGYGPRVLAVHQRIAAFRAPAAAPAPAPAPPAAALPAAAAPALAPVVEAVAPSVAGVTILPEAAQVFAGDLAAVRAVSLQAMALEQPEVATAGLLTRPVGSSTSGGAAGAVACLFGGIALLTICTTLWWHGRRFATAA